MIAFLFTFTKIFYFEVLVLKMCALLLLFHHRFEAFVNLHILSSLAHIYNKPCSTNHGPTFLNIELLELWMLWSILNTQNPNRKLIAERTLKTLQYSSCGIFVWHIEGHMIIQLGKNKIHHFCKKYSWQMCSISIQMWGLMQ